MDFSTAAQELNVCYLPQMTFRKEDVDLAAGNPRFPKSFQLDVSFSPLPVARESTYFARGVSSSEHSYAGMLILYLIIPPVS